MKIFRRILAILFALCGAGNAVAQFTGDSVVSLTLDYDSQRISVVFPTPEIDEGIVAGEGGEYYWRCQQTSFNTGNVIREEFAGINVGHPNSRFLTFRQISSFIDISGCDHITADLRVFSTGNTLTISGLSVRIAGIQWEGNPPYLTVNIGHTGDGYDEGDVYSFTVIYTDILGVTQTVRNDEQARLNRVFRRLDWIKMGGIRESDELPAIWDFSSFTSNSAVEGIPHPTTPKIGFRNIECTIPPCGIDVQTKFILAQATSPSEFGNISPAAYPFTYTLSHSHFTNTNTHFVRDDGFTVYLDHIGVRLVERFFREDGKYQYYYGQIRRNAPTEITQLELYRSVDPFSNSGTRIEEPVSFAEFEKISGSNNDEIYNLFSISGDRNNNIERNNIGFIWQHRINGGEWQNTEDEFTRGTYFTNPGHFVGAEGGDEIQIRGILDVEDGWGFRNYQISPVLSHTDRPPISANITLVYNRNQGQLTIIVSDVNDPDGNAEASYQFQGTKDGTLFADIPNTLPAPSNLASIYSIHTQVLNQGYVGFRGIATLTDPFFGQVKITSNYLQFVFPTQGEITIDGNPMFADGEIYTAITAGLSDRNGIGGFTYQWFSSIDGGNNYNEIAGETGESYTFESGDFAGADENTPARLQVSVVHTDADGYKATLAATLIENIPTQGEITINGNPSFADGEIYTAITAGLSDSNEIGGFTYQWFSSIDGGNNYNEIAGETGESYTLESGDFAGADENTPAWLQVSVVHTDADGFRFTLSASLVQDTPTRGEMTIDGSSLFENQNTYIVATDSLTDGNGIGLFNDIQWAISFDGGVNYNDLRQNTELPRVYRLNTRDFAGANPNTPARLRVSAVHTDLEGYTQPLTAILIQNIPTEGEITIDGNPMFAAGEIYTAITAALSDSNDIGDFTYQWFSSIDGGNNYNEIAGETGETYTADTADFAGANPNTPIFLGVSAVHTDLDGYAQTITAFLEQDLPTQGDIVLNAIADPLGLGEVRFSVNVDALTDGNDIGGFAYQWFASIARDADYNPISAATDRSYILDRSDFAGAAANEPVRISVSVVHTDLAGYEQSFGDFFVQNPRTEGEITIDGNPMFADGEIYTAITAGLSDRNGIGDFTYQWVISFDGGNNYNTNGILGIDSTYTLRAEDIANADENIPALLGVAAVHTDLDGNTQTLTASFLQDIAGTGSVSISGANSFAAGEKYTAITNIADANMIGTVSYSWQASTDGGNNYNLITDANSESYTLALSDFAGATSANPVHLLLSVVHTDMGGFSEFYLATLIHSDTAAGGSLGIGIQSGVIAEDAIVELDTAGVSDINGGGIVSHSWHLDNGAAIVGETSATYTLQAANLTLSEIRNGVLHSEVLYRDDFGYETRFSITLFGEGDDEEYDPNNPNELDSLGTGTVAISGTISFAANERYTADISDIAPNDANGEGDFAYSWHTSTDGGNNYTQITGATLELYTLALSDFAGANANAEVHLRVSVVHTDFGGFDQSYLATLIHSDTAAGGSLGIEIQSGVIAEDAIVELNTAGISDINGGGIVSHSWHLDNGAAIVGATAATYILSSANLTLSEIRNGVLHSEVLYRDSFGYETRFSITLFGEGDDEVANPDPNRPGTTTNPVDPGDNPGGEDPDNPGNIFGTGSVSISGANSFAAGEKYTAITNIADANMIGTVSYSWQASTDGGTNYTQITDANSESYTLALSDFSGATSANPVHLLLSVVHTDAAGFSEFYLATLIHSDTAAGGSLGIGIQSGVIAEDAIVELDTAAISDINGGGIISHSWHLDNGAAIVGATSATYTLQAANLTLSEIRNGVLHSEVLYRDSFGYETRFSITLFGEGDDSVSPNPDDPNRPGTTTNPVDPSDNPGGEDPDNPGNIFGTGSVSISGTISFAAGEKYTAITNIADANMIGTVSYSWQASTDGGNNYTQITDANSESYTLSLADFAGATSANPVHLLLSVVHTDMGGFSEFYLATLIHSDTAAGGSLGIVAAGLMAGDLVTADAAGLADANGALTISYRWQTGERNTPESFADLVGETEAVYTIYADDYDSGSRDSLRLIARTADPFGGETQITSAILPINRETEGRISLELVGGEIVAGATIRLRTDAVSDENGGGFEKYYWFINDLLLMEENDDFLIVRSDDLRDIAAGGLRAEAKYVDGIGFTVRLSARLIAAGIVAPSPEEIANWSVVIETEGVAFGEDLARANLIGAEQSDYYEVFYRWRTGVGIAFADERNVGGVGNYHQLEAANFNPQDHLRAIAEVELLSGTFVTLTSAPVQIDYPSIGAVRIVAGELLAPGVVVSADISDVRDANGGVNVVSERWLYADTPVAMARSYTLTEEAVHAGKVFYEATFADAAGFRTSLRAEANVGGEVSSEKAEAIIGAVNAAAIDGLWNALEGHLDSEAGWRANGAPIEDPSQIAAALSRRDENSLHPDSPFALDSFALKESGGEAGEEWSWWAHGSRSRLKGKPIIDGEEVKYHGDYASFHAGMDRQISDTVRAGLAFSADDADLDVEWRKGVDGQLRQNIRSLIPYTEWRPDDLTNVRILAGYGEGDIYLAEHDNASRASARRTLFGIRAARRKDLADNFDITFSGGFDKTRLQTDAIDLPGLQDDLDARTKETHARVKGGHISLLPAKGSLHKEISLRWRSQSVAGDRDSVFDFGIGFNATLPEYFLSFGADGERQLTDSAHERNRFGVYIAYGAGRFAHILETRYDNEIALPQNRWQINTVSEWGVSELLTGVYVEHNGNEDLRIGWESNLLF